MLNEKGQLTDTPTVKLLLRVFELDLTGILYLKREDVLKVLYFNRGKLIWAISNSQEDKLENVLISLNMTTQETLDSIEIDLNSSNTAGKALVENGIITLEELIEASRYQLKKIIDSVLTWQEGSFQFVKDTPPERLLSLDLKITDFVVKYIIEILDLNRVWEEIGSLQVKLLTTEEKSRIKKFNLTEKQSQLLLSFNGEVSLEHVLSRYEGAHRNSLLKIIYFFLMAELLTKPVIDYSGKDTVRTTTPVREEHSEPVVPEVPAVTEIHEEHAVTEVPEKPVLSEEPEVKTSSFVFDSQNSKGDDSSYSIEKETDVDAMISESMSKKGGGTKWFFIMSALFIVASILFFLQPDDINPFSGNSNPAKDDKTNTEIKKQDVAEKKLATQGKEPVLDLSKVNKDKYVNPGQQKKKPEAQQKKTDKKTDKKTEPAVKKKKVTEPVVKKQKTTPQPTSSVPPVEYLKKGQLIIAGDLWKRELNASPYTHGILLELACQKTSIMKAFREIHDKTYFYILNIKRGKRVCFLVMYGKFKSAERAERSLKSIPQYFWKQSPPRVTDLSKYIR